MPTQGTTLVIDVGSSSVRACVGESLARREHSFRAEATADPVALRHLVEACIDEIATDGVEAVGMATFAANLLGVDADGQPITPLYTYADTRASTDADALIDEMDAAEIHARTGCRLHPAYHPAKLRWLKRTQPDLFRRVHRWLDFGTYCYGVWFGREVPCSYSIASWSGLLDRHALTWDAPWLEALRLDDDALPPLADFDAVQRDLCASYAQRWPDLDAVPFYLTVGDGAAANIGSGGTDADHPVLTVGTTAALRVVTTEPGDLATGLWAYRVDQQRHLIGGATSEGGNILAWAQTMLKLDVSTIDAALRAREPGDHGLIALPTFAGERSPGYLADAVGTLHGLRLGTSPLDVLQALLEGVALRLRLIYDLMDRPGEAILAAGGALTHLPAWGQILADMLDVPLHRVDVPEATVAGVERLISGEMATPTPEVIAPRPGLRERVDALLAAHVRFYEQING